MANYAALQRGLPKGSVEQLDRVRYRVNPDSRLCSRVEERRARRHHEPEEELEDRVGAFRWRSARPPRVSAVALEVSLRAAVEALRRPLFLQDGRRGARLPRHQRRLRRRRRRPRRRRRWSHRPPPGLRRR